MQRTPLKHCRECGFAVAYRLPDDGDTRERAICTACHTVHYENPLNVVGTVPVWEDSVLLCRRNIEPRHGFWTLPAGFMELGESTEAGAVLVFRLDQSAWTFSQALRAPDGAAGDLFGMSVASDGPTMVIGASLPCSTCSRIASARTSAISKNSR